jgi:hypothetical protein
MPSHLSDVFAKDCPHMTNRVSYAPQDFQKMCRQAERDHESKKLVVLMARVKRQIAERQGVGLSAAPNPATAASRDSDSNFLRMPTRSVPLER